MSTINMVRNGGGSTSFYARYYDGGLRRRRAFRSEDEAQAFLDSIGQSMRLPGGLRLPPAERLRSLSAVDSNGCWIWGGSMNNAGYGQLPIYEEGRQRTHLAHRVSYETFVAPIPAGLVIDHLCRVRACCNLEHLEPVTQQENILRSPIAPAALNAAKTHCPRGHAYTRENLYNTTPRGGRQCRLCAADRYAARRAGAVA